MKANNNQWPECWDDLFDDYQTVSAMGAPGRPPWTFEELMSDVEVDWEISQEQLLSINRQSEFDLIWIRSDDGNGRDVDSAPPSYILKYIQSIPPPAPKPRVRW